MKKFLYTSMLLLSFAVISTSCDKVKDELEDQALNNMSMGEWVVNSFTEGSADLTTQFDGWIIRVAVDGSGYAYKGVDTVRGTFVTNFSTYTVTATLNNTIAPLEKLNGEWTATDATETTTKFKRTAGSVNYTMGWRKR